MILALLLAQAAAGTPMPADAMVRSLQNFRGVVRDGGSCTVRRSTGDAEIDRIGCAAIETCMPQYQSRLAGSNDRAIQPGTRRVMQAALGAELSECLTGIHTRMAGELAARRKGS
ncbi:hypothetical protein [Sphingomonas sp. RS2018]